MFFNRGGHGGQAFDHPLHRDTGTVRIRAVPRQCMGKGKDIRYIPKWEEIETQPVMSPPSPLHLTLQCPLLAIISLIPANLVVAGRPRRAARRRVWRILLARQTYPAGGETPEGVSNRVTILEGGQNLPKHDTVGAEHHRLPFGLPRSIRAWVGRTGCGQMCIATACAIGLQLRQAHCGGEGRSIKESNPDSDCYNKEALLCHWHQLQLYFVVNG